VLSTALAVVLFSSALFGQGNFGRIFGTVTDPTGAVLPGAQISIIDKDRGLARSLVSDEVGLYNAPTLIPGTYTVRVELPGFKVLDRQNVVVEVGQEIRVDVTVQPGAVGDTVTVNEAIPLVDTTSGTLGGVLENAAINDMPLNGRNYQNLLNLLPGVMAQPGGSPWTQSTNNARPDETNWMVDGVFNGNYVDRRPIANMPSPFTDGATILPIDAIQEFHLEENPKAEYGGLAGAVVNVGIRSGTNSYHGSAYAFGRNGAWGARNFFTPGAAPETQLEQFGGVLGGPVMKDKLFFFGGYEGLRSLVGNALGSLVPATGSLGADPAHSMVDALNALRARGVTPSPVSLKLMGCTLAAPYSCTGGVIQNAPANTTTYNSGFPNTNTSDNGVGKIDYRVNNQHSVNSMVFIGNYFGDGEDHPITASYWKNGDPIRTYTVTSNWIWSASSQLLNDFRFGFNNLHFGLAPDDANLFANGKDYPLNTGVTSAGGFPNLEITGFPGQVMGSWRGRPIDFNNPVFNFQDNLSYLKGKHGFKFGGEFAHIHTDYNIHDTRGRIQFRGKQTFAGSTPLEDYFAGKPTRAFLTVGKPLRQLNWTSTAAFFQDDWRIAPKLTLNLGLRWSFVSPFKEANGLLGGFDPVKGLIQQGQPGYDSVFKTDYKNFSPRIGFAWDITGNGTTVLRGGSSVLYSSYSPAQWFQSSPQSFGGTNGPQVIPTGACTVAVSPGTPCPSTFGGSITSGNATIPGSFLNWDGVVFPAGAVFSCTTAAPCNLVTIDPNLKYPYIVNWNFGIQHAFTNNLSLDLSYVANHGDRLSGRRDINQIDPATGVRPYAAKYPYLQYIDQTQNYVRSNYNSLQTTLTQRFARGVAFKAGYTYGHGLDNGSLNRFALSPQDSRHPEREYASSDSDVRHRLTITGSYDIPGIKGFGQLMDGWKVNTIVNIQSAQPWNIDDTGNDFSGISEFADRWNFYGNPKDFTSGANGIPYCDFSGVADITKGIGGVNCSQQSQISGIYTKLSPSLAQQCVAKSADLGTLAAGGCYVSANGRSVMVPPKAGTFGTMGRNIFRDSGFKNVDFSVFKTFKFKERLNAQFRAEFFNVFNHPIVANPYGSANGSQLGWDPSSSGGFGSGGATPDVAAGNPFLGSGSPRVLQLGLKLQF
jgi:hypothetical protein